MPVVLVVAAAIDARATRATRGGMAPRSRTRGRAVETLAGRDSPLARSRARARAMLRSARAWLLSPSLTARESIARAPSATRDATTSDDDDAFEDVEDEFAPALRSTQETLVERDARARAAIEVIDLLDDDDDDDDDGDGDGDDGAAEREEDVAAKRAERRVIDATTTHVEARRVRRRVDDEARGARDDARLDAATTVVRNAPSRSNRNADATKSKAFPEPDSRKQLYSQVTCALDAKSFKNDSAYGRSLVVRFDNNRHKAGDKQILYEYENLPLERSVTWTYHAVSDVPVRSDDVGAHSARYTAVLLSGDAFLKLIENDSAGLRKMVETFERETGGGEHKLCVIVESPDKFCTSKERRGCDYDNPNAGWSRDEYDMCVAQIVVQYADVVLVALPGMAECVEHVVMIHDAIARRRHEPPLSKDFLLDKSHDYMDGTSGKSKKPTSQDFFLRALQRISGVTAPHARSIVREYKSMAALMSAYEDPRTSIADKENMLKDIVGGKNRFGEVKSKRVYDFFKPRHPDDPGDEIISREHARA
jgi:hypothetical protein